MRPRNKFGAQKTEVDGITFDSKREASRYCELKMMQRAGEISDLELQPVFRLEVPDARVGGFMFICRYIADFRYLKNGEVVVEDAKSPATAKLEVFRLKKKLMRALHGIDVVEV